MPTNKIIDTISAYMISLLHNEETIYLSFDSSCVAHEGVGTHHDNMKSEFLNTITYLGYCQALKIGGPVMLLGI